jgi:XTP/dITP diphosphohydrolase
VRRLLIATTNPGKVREIRQVLDGVSVELVTLADLPPVVEPEETGPTFAENARLKAIYYRTSSGLPTVAEDSGLAIDALGGRPGVESARYPGATYAEKFANLYRELAPHARPWTARFVCALAFIGEVPGTGPQAAVAFESEGIVEGRIVSAPRGSNGFGYDPIFFYPPYDCTLGEASDAQKLVVSHRGQAFRKFKEWLA